MTINERNEPAAPIQLTIDHVTIAGSTLATLEAGFAAIGLTTDYGGPHSNGVTHMSLLGFDDGSYIELISSMQPGQKDNVFWGEHIAGELAGFLENRADEIVADLLVPGQSGDRRQAADFLHRKQHVADRRIIGGHFLSSWFSRCACAPVARDRRVT